MIKTPSTKKMWKNWKSHGSWTLLVGIQNDSITLENSLEVSYNIKHSLACYSLWGRTELDATV